MARILKTTVLCQFGTKEDGLWGPESQRHGCGLPAIKWYCRGQWSGAPFEALVDTGRVVPRCELHAAPQFLHESGAPWVDVTDLMTVRQIHNL